MEPSDGSLESKCSWPCQRVKPSSSPAQRPREKRYGYFNFRKTVTIETYLRSESTATISAISKLTLWSARKSLMFEQNTATFAITTVEICKDDKQSTTATYTQTKMLQIYSPNHLLKISICISSEQWVYGNWRSFGGWFMVRFKVVCSWNMDFFVYIDDHPQGMVVHFPYSLASQDFKEDTFGITDHLFSSYMERGDSGMCCIYGLSPWRMASVGLMQNLPEVMVIQESARHARRKWRCLLSADACAKNKQDILQILRIWVHECICTLEYKLQAWVFHHICPETFDWCLELHLPRLCVSSCTIFPVILLHLILYLLHIHYSLPHSLTVFLHYRKWNLCPARGVITMHRWIKRHTLREHSHSR